MQQDTQTENNDIYSNAYYRIQHNQRVTFTQAGLKKYRPCFVKFGLKPRRINTALRLMKFLQLAARYDDEIRFVGLELANPDFILRRFNDATMKQDTQTSLRLYELLNRHFDGVTDLVSGDTPLSP